jgi:2-polyprenyl-3-methyl-5-hydroxy-6-metoxy-1,4-benzoquinol methylase
VSAPAAESIWTATSDVAYMRSDGRGDHPSHDTVIDWLREQYADGPVSVLDCGVMSGVTYERLAAAMPGMNYTGIDVSQAILDDCRARFPDAAWESMSVTDLAYADSSFDVVHCRHLLECLPYYETAVREIFRVARHWVVLCLFQVPAEPEALLRRVTPGGYIWLNRYAPGPLEDLLGRLSSDVSSVDVAQGRKVNRVYFCRVR